MDTQSFIDRWSSSGASERANKDLFFVELCDLLGVARPEPARGDPAHDRYTFERDALLRHEDGSQSIGKIDLYKEGCFVLEAKQGSESGSKKHGSGRRDSPEWFLAMNAAYGQALKYVETLEAPPPFVVACDIGHCFDLYACFDGRGDYRPFPNARAKRLWFKDLPEQLPTLRALFTDPASLDPARRATRITREVAGHLADLARALETAGHRPELVAEFLMRCIFTMFAESAGLLPERLFIELIEEKWLPHPERFAKGVETLWRTMDKGGFLAEGESILRFNGGLFQDPTALPLGAEHLPLLLEAARCDWSDVEPSIFGTLLERALDPRERHRLGAHYTPRAYVERLVRATVEEPLRAEWQEVQAAVRILVEAGKLEDARKAVRAYYQKLCKTRVLDPACGTGNFLYVTLDLFKRLETEVWAQLAELGESQERLGHEGSVVTPAQFHGIEVKRWAKEIAELVLWIGYLQWHLRTHGKKERPPEPVLRNYQNIECRDAVLAYDREEVLLDDKGKPVTRWDGVTTKRHPATGEEVPDEASRIPVMKYVNPRPAEWPEVDYIVGNPPFVGKARRRAALGDGYIEALCAAYPEVPEGADYVMWWWFKAAQALRSGAAIRFGLITTNSLTQALNRRVVADALGRSDRFELLWAIPDHPWVDSSTGAAVRIAMTVMGERREQRAILARVTKEDWRGDDEVAVLLDAQPVKRIHPDLRAGANVSDAQPLQANAGVCTVGVVLFGKGFLVDEAQAKILEPAVLRRFLNGRDLIHGVPPGSVIDFYPHDEREAKALAARAFQHLLDRVKPERDQIRDPGSRARWWRFGRDKPELRAAIAGLRRYAATVEVSKHRYFIFLESSVVPDHTLINIATDDGYILGVLSGRIHCTWALAAGGTLEDRPRYNPSLCFEPFPFPDCTSAQRSRIRQLGEDLDAHRKRQQAAHPELTITGMYNVIEKLRAGEPLTDKEKVIHEQGLVSVLRQLHDDLDAAVFDAYGWPRDIADEQILERLVALNAERAEEERKGLVRWLRPDFQSKGAVRPLQTEMAGLAAAPSPAAGTPIPWPKTLPERIAAVRERLRPNRAQDLPALAAAFKRAPKKDLEAVLQSLAALGLAVAYETPSGTRWRLTLRRAA